LVAPVVKALQALRGLALVAAPTLVVELGDITRFANPRRFMAYLGLVPSEHCRKHTPQGGITQAGNGAARRLRIEAAWSCRFPARIGHDLLLRQEKSSKPVRDMAWKVQERAFVCLAIAQTNRERSRAIAAVIPVFSFPACPSLPTAQSAMGRELTAGSKHRGLKRLEGSVRVSGLRERP
jgi:Transposase IS116/IS110/IS902 family